MDIPSDLKQKEEMLAKKHPYGPARFNEKHVIQNSVFDHFTCNLYVHNHYLNAVDLCLQEYFS